MESAFSKDLPVVGVKGGGGSRREARLVSGRMAGMEGVRAFVRDSCGVTSLRTWRSRQKVSYFHQVQRAFSCTAFVTPEMLAEGLPGSWTIPYGVNGSTHSKAHTR